MKLKRTTMMAAYPHVGTKDFYAADDVDALLARIREAVEVERDATLRHVLSRAKDRAPAFLAAERACNALDALLSGAETVHQCPPDGSGIMPCCGRTPFEVLADRMATDPALVTCKGKRGSGSGA